MIDYIKDTVFVWCNNMQTLPIVLGNSFHDQEDVPHDKFKKEQTPYTAEYFTPFHFLCMYLKILEGSIPNTKTFKRLYVKCLFYFYIVPICSKFSTIRIIKVNLKNNINKQTKQKQTHRCKEQTDDCQRGWGLRNWMKKLKRMKDTDWQFQHSHGDIIYSIGNRKSYLEGIQQCHMKNRNIYWRRYKIQETWYIGQWYLHPLQSGNLGTSHSSPSRHQLPHHIFLNLIDDLNSLPFQRWF